MSHVKAGGTAKNLRDSPGQRLGVKLYGGQKTRTGNVIVRQVGMTKRAGKGTKLSRNFTIHAHTEGIVKYTTRRVRLFTGRSVKRVEVTVEQPAAKAPVAKKAAKPAAPKAEAKK
ncbi:MAG TPA: 50S ribosomal protein L27 [Candidatus Saccharimonadales bacterium]|nr:50S ribosomal protein L27 [Candidatus Saccharimonadales bacterium]